VKHEAWARDAGSLGVDLTEAELGQLSEYLELLESIAVPRGMIAASDVGRLWERHIRDGLRGVGELRTRASVADLGSGAGIPGLPLAVAMPATSFALIEPRRARASFLEAVVDRLGLVNVSVVVETAERVSDRFEACTARAFSSPVESWSAAERLLAPSGVLVYWAGARFDRGPLDDLGIPVRLSTPPDLARTGPLVIMGPQ